MKGNLLKSQIHEKSGLAHTSFKKQTFYQLKVKIFVSIFLVLYLDMEIKQTALKNKEVNCVLLKNIKS